MSNRAKSGHGLKQGKTYIFEGEPKHPRIEKIKIHAKKITADIQVCTSVIAEANIIKEEITTTPTASDQTLDEIESHVGQNVNISGPSESGGLVTVKYFYTIIYDYPHHHVKNFDHILKRVQKKNTIPYNEPLSHLSSFLKIVDTLKIGGSKKNT